MTIKLFCMNFIEDHMIDDLNPILLAKLYPFSKNLTFIRRVSKWRSTGLFNFSLSHIHHEIIEIVGLLAMHLLAMDGI